jgi:mRNA-degrading endonuclease toxin of MazEF toxin-antitoxin module
MLKRGDIVLLRVIFSDSSGSKVRPCLIVRQYQKDFNFLEISSRDYLEDAGHTFSLTTEKYPNLKKNSHVKIWKINTKDTIELSDSPKVLATLKKEDMDTILERLHNYLKEN